MLTDGPTALQRQLLDTANKHSMVLHCLDTIKKIASHDVAGSGVTSRNMLVSRRLQHKAAVMSHEQPLHYVMWCLHNCWICAYIGKYTMKSYLEHLCEVVWTCPRPAIMESAAYICRHPAETWCSLANMIDEVMISTTCSLLRPGAD